MGSVSMVSIRLRLLNPSLSEPTQPGAASYSTQALKIMGIFVDLFPGISKTSKVLLEIDK